MTATPTKPLEPHAALLSRGPWRLVVDPPASGAANMAMDYALMARARETGERVFRVYSWARPTLSFGRNQSVRGVVDLAQAEATGVDLVRRPTGGRALLHHREVTYSVTAPLGPGDSARAWYGAINVVLLDALRALGVRATPAIAVGRTPVPGTASCFVRADAGEIAVDGRKLVGSALLRQDGAILQHGSILLEDDQVMLRRLLPDSAPQPAGTLRSALGRIPGLAEVAEALFAALRGAGAQGASRWVPDEGLLGRARAAESIFGADDWTNRN